MPGDDRTPCPRVQSTRAVTIDAPPEQVWPWLLQMGIGRAGFYTHDWVERLMETGMLTGIKARAERQYCHADNAGTATAAVEPMAATN